MLERIGGWLAAFLLALAVVSAGPALAQSQPAAPDVTQLQVERNDEGVVLSATVRFDLPAVIDDALGKGIPMFFVAEASIFRGRWYWYDKRVAGAVRHMRLSYQPLTRRWRLQVSSSPIGHSGMVLGQNFDSRDEALAAIQRISRWRIADPGEVDPELPHEVQFRFRLDLSQLPRPFQIGAVGQSEWSIQAMRVHRLLPEAAR
ncbi:MAG TPA: DUF4390 domain-containing protein [Ramlibacter sp.]|jgi:hypothetical protein